MPAKAKFLTDRQRTALQLLADGKNEIQASMALGISDRTFRTHIARAEKTLGAQSRLDAVLKAIRHGVVRLPLPAPLPDDGNS